MSKPHEGDKRVWHHGSRLLDNPPFDGTEDCFFFPVGSEEEAGILIKALHRYDEYLYERDYLPTCNKYHSGERFSGLHVFIGGEWVEWDNANGDDIHTMLG